MVPVLQSGLSPINVAPLELDKVSTHFFRVVHIIQLSFWREFASLVAVIAFIGPVVPFLHRLLVNVQNAVRSRLPPGLDEIREALNPWPTCTKERKDDYPLLGD